MKTIYTADDFLAEFDRLGVSTDDSYLGLSCGIQNNVVARIYDDHESGIYDAIELLPHLQAIKSASLTPNAQDNIWALIREFEL